MERQAAPQVQVTSDFAQVLSRGHQMSPDYREASALVVTTALFTYHLLDVASYRKYTMNIALQMLLPMAGFIGGIFLWSRMAHLAVALSGLTPNPSNPAREFAGLESAYRRMVLSLAAGWLIIIGTVFSHMLYSGKTGWAFLIGGLLAVPLFTVTNFLLVVRRHKRLTTIR
jgi:hypothetical protein